LVSTFVPIASDLLSLACKLETSSVKVSIASLEEEMTSTKGANETLTEEVSSLQAKLNKSDAIGTKVDTNGDPAVIKKTAVQDANAGFYNALVGRIQNRFIN
jgi:hypothetical protein